MKPDGFAIKVRRRPGKDWMVGLKGSDAKQNGSKNAKTTTTAKPGDASGKISIFYGSNAGTCKTFAQDLQAKAPEMGFEATISSLDEATEHLHEGVPAVLITSSYEGKPPDNAKKFVAWLESIPDGEKPLKNDRFAIFGVGNSEWASTFHKVPKVVDELMEKCGATRLCPTGLADVKEDCTNEWEKWMDSLWESVRDGASTKSDQPRLKVEIQAPHVTMVLGGSSMSWARVVAARSLGGTEVGPEKRDLEVVLPKGITYRPGNHLRPTHLEVES